jgi:hypothetical protein
MNFDYKAPYVLAETLIGYDRQPFCYEPAHRRRNCRPCSGGSASTLVGRLKLLQEIPISDLRTAFSALDHKLSVAE